MLQNLSKIKDVGEKIASFLWEALISVHFSVWYQLAVNLLGSSEELLKASKETLISESKILKASLLVEGGKYKELWF